MEKDMKTRLEEALGFKLTRTETDILRHLEAEKSGYKQPESLDTLAKKAQYYNAGEGNAHFYLGCSNPRKHVHTELGDHMYYKPLSFEQDGIGVVKMFVFEDSHNHDKAYTFRLEAEQIREAVKQKIPIDLTEDMATHIGKEAVKELDSPVDLISQLL